MTNAPAMVSGIGQYHTDEPGKANRRPYLALTPADIRRMIDQPQQVGKTSSQWLIPSVLPSRSHKKQAEQGEFHLLWADIDGTPPPLVDVASTLGQLILNGCQFEVYASRSATVERQKCRILIPLDKPLRGEDWKLCQQVLNDKLAACGIEPDSANEGAGQILYLPNRGAFYASESCRKGDCFKPLLVWASEIAAKREDHAAKQREMEARRQAAAERRSQLSVEDTGGNLIAIFNATYPVEELLLRAGYDQEGNRFRHPQSESGSFSANVLNDRVHSLSANDPLFTGASGGGAHDAFSAFSVLFAGGDTDNALQLAGDQWLAIEGESWNAVKRREYARQKAQENALKGFNAEPDMPAHERFKLLTAREMAALPPIRWRIKGVLPETGIGAIYGPSGSGKSFLVLDMLACIVGGRDWFGNETKSSLVVYLGLEGEAGIAQRIRAWQQVSGTLPDGFRAIFSPLNIRKDTDRAALVLSIKDADMAGGVLVIDTLNQATAGMDENDSAAMGLAIAAVKALQRELGGLVVLIHHSGKDATKGLRGHSSLLAALDTSIEVSRTGELREWRVGKAKDGRDGDGRPFTLETVEIDVDDDLSPITSCVVRPSTIAGGRANQPKVASGGNQKIVWDALQTLFREIGNQEDWEQAERPRISVEDAISKIRGKLPVEARRRSERAQQAINGLVSKGLLECADGYLMMS